MVQSTGKLSATAWLTEMLLAWRMAQRLRPAATPVAGIQVWCATTQGRRSSHCGQANFRLMLLWNTTSARRTSSNIRAADGWRTTSKASASGSLQGVCVTTVTRCPMR